MLLRRLLAIRKVDAELPREVMTALIDSLYAPFASLVVGAVSGGVIGLMVSYRSHDPVLSACSLAVFLVGAARIVCGAAYRRRPTPDTPETFRSGLPTSTWSWRRRKRESAGLSSRGRLSWERRADGKKVS